jgi:ferredoxin-type protein NapG
LKVSRRQLLGTTTSFAAVIGLLAVGEMVPNRSLVRPPGAAREDRFLASCIRCGVCSDVCPVHGIGISHLDDGFTNIGTPKLTGYCIVFKGLENPTPESVMTWRKNTLSRGEEKRCLDCIDVCPTGALRQEDAKQLHMGVAVVQKEYCKAWKFGNCQFPCRDVCPFDAISVTEGPVVDETKCVGCGQCDFVCLARLIGPTGILVEPIQT